ncbi:MAG: S9 family peptidase, partial [bacterium]|nr:S9 family peptidase [bacterium]
SAAAAGGTVVTARAAGPGRTAATEVMTPTGRIPIASAAAAPPLSPRPRFCVVGSRELRAAVVFPSDDSGADGDSLPVLLDPYGGPHAQRVLNARSPFLVSQWFADQGFAVVVTDGRGTPGRGPAWERAVAGDLAHPVLEDQIDALDALAEQHPRLDLSRVAVRGWSFGGYLAALAVLARPDRFHTAIAGAPVTDWRLYDTHYTERYLGRPDRNPEAYTRTSLLELAGGLSRPLLLICGLADDNVFAAHTLRLSQALFEAGRPHQVLPLPGVTHMTPQEQVAENLLLLQRAFLFDSLDAGPPE